MAGLLLLGAYLNGAYMGYLGPKRRWPSARLRFHELLAGVLPDSQYVVST